VILRFAEALLPQARLQNLQDFLQSFPVEFAGRHFLLVPPPGVMRAYKETISPMFALTSGGDTQTLLRESPQELLPDLLQLGLDKAGLPECVGGTWSYENHTQWVNSRRRSSQQVIPDKTERETSQDEAQQVETETQTEKALRELHAAIALASFEDKAAYLDALKQSTELVKDESDPIRFLQRENFDPTAAAKRLLMYWKGRKECFGHKAFLPLRLGPDGALYQEDIAALKTGYMSVLPPTRDGLTTVCVVNYSRLQGRPPPTTKSRLRIMFFLNHCYSANPKSATEGIVMICLSNSATINMLPKLDSSTLFVAMDTIFTFRMKSLYIVDCRGNVDATSFLIELLPPAIHFFGRVWRDAMVPVFGNNRAEVLSKLQDAGLEREHLPSSMGGTLNYDQFVMDWLRSKGLLVDEDIPMDMGEPGGANLGELVERSRRRNDRILRRKLERARLKEAFYNDLAAVTRKTNWELKQESQRLEGLVRSALLDIISLS
jgi:hypothetical protein